MLRKRIYLLYTLAGVSVERGEDGIAHPLPARPPFGGTGGKGGGLGKRLSLRGKSKGMGVRVQRGLPAIGLLEKEGIAVGSVVQGVGRMGGGEGRALRVGIVNLMPLKIATETDFVRALSYSSLAVEVEFIKLSTYEPKHTSMEHLREFYRDFGAAADLRYDGLIVTGAPVERLPFEDVTYWRELTEVFDWARRQVRSTLYICWAAQAALYHFYGIPKYELAEKMFGIFGHCVREPLLPIVRGFDATFFAPHSHHTEVRRGDILGERELTLVSESEEAGVYMALSRSGGEIYVTGHPEYAPGTLDEEYRRDVAKGMPIRPPENYYLNDDPTEAPVVRWRGHAHLLFGNWLRYYVGGGGR